jgi:DNA-binding beta-propeller fold protein YncE
MMMALILALGLWLWRTLSIVPLVTTVDLDNVQPTGVTFDAASGHILVSGFVDANTGEAWQIWLLDGAGRHLLRRLNGAAHVVLSPHLGQALVATDDGVLLLDTRNGQPLRTFPGTLEPLILTESGDRVVATTSTRNVAVFAARSGARLPFHSPPTPFFFPNAYPFERSEDSVVLPALHRAVVVIGGNQAHSSNLFLLDTQDGSLLADYSYYADPYGLAVDGVTRRIFVAKGRSEGADVATLDLRTGCDLGFVHASPSIAQMALDAGRNALFVLQGEPYNLPPPGHILQLDARNGQLRRVMPISTDLPIAMALDHAQGVLWVLTVPRSSIFVGGSTAGRLAQVNIGAGRVARSVPVCDNPTGLIMDERRARIYLACAGKRKQEDFSPAGAGSIEVLDTRTGAIIRDIGTNPGPRIAALDALGGRLYITTEADTISTPDPWSWLPEPARRFLQHPASPPTRDVPPTLQVIDLSRL